MGEKYGTVKILRESSTSGVFNLILNRPSVSNALSLDFFSEFPKALDALDQNPDVVVIVLSGAGNHFCGGLDLKSVAAIANNSSGDHGLAIPRLRRQLKFMQDAITAIERCRKPVIAAIQGECRGLGVDIVTACDIRYCSKDAFFSVKEVDMGITADVGTLQRLPGIVGFGNAMELSLTARRFSGEEAKELGLVSRVFGSKVELKEGVRTIAEGIGEKPPLAVVGTKAVLIRSRDVSVEQGLDYVATWNSSMLLSDDLNQAISAYTHKRKPTYAKL
ncbi:delta(3,5)-Delta(2,4)-dienoyl-CoA isomerase, peroxisomal-like isoform X2 [Hibiscus syriacus]|uniref:delta(3,5)-Delta(2,4)-dienoyl-CoA isomerase, peroxisomal-like isoform X2 n=1 Tax=Hibiscus syriacus TaxID=106335 RepID=UPI00192153A7|nr:delta(3,5)-Delta(2,4)-dienoyl-CoA isomerase, peroxisomal-like isoform X2 [Hibiscus syriacus]